MFFLFMDRDSAAAARHDSLLARQCNSSILKMLAHHSRSFLGLVITNKLVNSFMIGTSLLAAHSVPLRVVTRKLQELG